MTHRQPSQADGSSFIARYEKLRREEILSDDSQPDVSEPPSPQTAADESETTEQSVWSSYAQAHQVMIADPATLSVLQGVPAAKKVDAQPDTNELNADLQAGDDVPAEEPPLEGEGWQDLQFPVAGEMALPEAIAEQQNSQDWSETEAVLVAAAEAVEDVAGETMEEAAVTSELQTPQPAVSRLALADLAEVTSRLSSEGMGAWGWLSALANSFADTTPARTPVSEPTYVCLTAGQRRAYRKRFRSED